MESWRHVWRDGLAPVLPTIGLAQLLTALRADDPQLKQGMTTQPPPLACSADWPCEGADAIGFAGWSEPFMTTVGQVEEFFAKACFDCDSRLGDPAACRHFLNWYDDAPRDEMRRELGHEVARALVQRCEWVLVPSAGVPVELRLGLAADPKDAATHGAIADWYEGEGDRPTAELWRMMCDLLIETTAPLT